MEEPVAPIADHVAPSIEPPSDQHSKLPDMNDAPRVLTPPASEEEMDKGHQSSSELSDINLDEDDDDFGEIEPDHYFDGGKIPVFKPTMDQFRSFKKFTEKIDKYGMKSGIVKVIPPPEWRDSLPALNEAVKAIKIKNPIMQEFAGTHGTYTQANIEKQRSYNLPQWKSLCEETNHQPPAKRGERRANNDVVARAVRTARSSQASSPTSTPDATKKKRGRPPKNQPRAPKLSDEVVTEDADTEEQPEIPPTPTSPDAKPEPTATPTEEKGDADDYLVEQQEPLQKPKAKPRARQPKAKSSGNGEKKSVTSRRMYNRREANEEIDEEAFKNFNYKLENSDEFTRERCQELEQVYWKTLNYGTPMYGADMPGSLFDDRTTSWNVAHLENLLDVLGTKVPGVNTTYVYLGMWKATFAWHLEDVDLYSINYIHFGAPKQWYSISQEDARRFESAMKTLWPQDAKHCDQFLRHKTYLISPEKLKSQFGIKVNKLIHYEGEFVITYPYGYHSGFNLGYNCAESVNFATEAWLNYGRIAKKCNCEADSVWVNVNEIERKLHGEPTPEYYTASEDDGDEEDEADQIPTPPASVRGKAKPVSRKRKRDIKDTAKEPGRKVKRLKIRVKIPGAEPCILCPNDVSFDVLLPTDNGKKAHRLCALYTPETYLAVENGVEKVFNVARINKDRLNAKCNFCRGKRIAFQCDSRKCARGYHATCAAAAGVQVDSGPMPLYIDGVEYISDGFDFRCRFHRPKRPKNTDSDSLEENVLVREYAKNLKKGDVVQAMHLGSDVFAGTVIENMPGEMCILIDVVPGSDRVEVEWKYLLVLDPDQSERIKPSPDAKPMPEHLLNNQDVNASNKKEGIPEIDDFFTDPGSEYKWAEFHTCAVSEARNPFQKKIDFDKLEQLWFYLGKTSTEARAQYTHDPKKPVHNPKSVFLHSIRSSPQPIVAAQRPSYSASYSKVVNAAQLQNPYGYKSTGQQQQNQSQQRLEKPYQYKPKVEAQPNNHSPHLPYGYQFNNQQPIQPRPPAPSVNYPQFPLAGSTAQSHGQQQTPKAQTKSTNHHSPLNYQTPLGARQSSTGLYDNSPPFQNYYQAAERKYSAQKPMEHRYEFLASPIQYHRNPATPAPTANMSGQTSISPNVTNMSHSRSDSNGTSNAEYLQSLNKYPYLRNSYLRRPKVYVSPYKESYGFTAEWAARLQSKPIDLPIPVSNAPNPQTPITTGHTNSTTSSSSANGYVGIDNPIIPPQLPHSQPLSQFQYQTQQQFQAQMHREANKNTEERTGINKFEQIMKQLASPYSAPHIPAGQIYASTGPIAHGWPWLQGLANGMKAARDVDTKTPPRPDYSPISEAATPKKQVGS